VIVQHVSAGQLVDGGVRILVIEDDMRLVASWRRDLESDGFAADVASDGPEGGLRAYDAILCGITLPSMSRHQVCGELRKADARTPVLMLAAREDNLDEARALNAGADDFLSKPFSHVVLVARLRALLRRANRQRSHRPEDVGWFQPLGLSPVRERMVPRSRAR
jgi:two-component system, OmpR family, response regulator